MSVLTYNVHGLPWPIAGDRTADLAMIATRLRGLRAQGSAPRIVVLQEAFTDDARAIGHAAGYRYVISGPAADGTASKLSSPMDREFAGAARWWHGETEGKLLGSGLQILSDYPVRDIRRVAFPASACAGYDCLANKGALFARIFVPGASPVDIVTTHLNSRRASGVADARADQAYAMQIDIVTRFVQRAHDPRNPLIVAGDFNVGKAAARRGDLLGAVRARWPGALDALREAQRRRLTMSADARAALRHGKDWQFFSGGSTARLDLAGIAVPFGHDPDGGMLSDHVGYMAYFRIGTAPLTTLSRSIS